MKSLLPSFVFIAILPWAAQAGPLRAHDAESLKTLLGGAGYVPPGDEWTNLQYSEEPVEKLEYKNPSAAKVYGSTQFGTMEALLEHVKSMDQLEEREKQAPANCEPPRSKNSDWNRHSDDLMMNLMSVTATGIDLNMQKAAQESIASKKCDPKKQRCDKRFTGNCLRGIKYAQCMSRVPAEKIVSGAGAKECMAGVYASSGSAKDYPAELLGSGEWINIHCQGAGGKTMTPAEAPVNSIICYKAIDMNARTANGKADTAAKHGHCEIKVSNCKFCYDGCAKRPRTGDLHAASGKNREVFAVMVLKKGSSQKSCPLDNRPKTPLRAQGNAPPSNGTR